VAIVSPQAQSELLVSRSELAAAKSLLLTAQQATEAAAREAQARRARRSVIGASRPRLSGHMGRAGCHGSC
jgi:hypothetical protein